MPNHGEYTIYLVKRAQIFEEFEGLLDRWNENCTLNTERKKKLHSFNLEKLVQILR